MLLYSSQNSNMSEKWRHFGAMMSSNWFVHVTFVFQFLIRELKKNNACQYLYFKMLLNISQSTDMSSDWLLSKHLYFTFKFITLKEKLYANTFILKYYYLYAKMPTCRQNAVVELIFYCYIYISVFDLRL